jgi:hypothetical protein
MQTEKRKENKSEKKKKKKTNRKLQVRNCIPIPLSILQPSSCQIQSSLAATAYDKQTKYSEQ